MMDPVSAVATGVGLGIAAAQLDVVDDFLSSLHSLRRHKVKMTDNLSVISQCYYGTPKHALVIYQHNRDLLNDPNNIPWGVEIVIPHIPHAHGTV